MTIGQDCLLSSIVLKDARIPAVSKRLGIAEFHVHRIRDENRYRNPTLSSLKAGNSAGSIDTNHTNLLVGVDTLEE